VFPGNNKWELCVLCCRHCPSSLVAPLTRIVIDEIKLACKKQPAACGYHPAKNSKFANPILNIFFSYFDICMPCKWRLVAIFIPYPIIMWNSLCGNQLHVTVFLEELMVVELAKKLFPRMESLPCSQKPTIGPYPKRSEPTLRLYTVF
jgi:hypothetical protein